MSAEHSIGNSPRLNREAWLAKALDVLAEGPDHLRINELAERLGVSKGSFYWHFENRSAFIYAIAEYWRDYLTNNIVDGLSDIEVSAEDRLYTLMSQIVENRLSRYDLAVRAWARHEPTILPIIREVDRIRLNALRGLFTEMGFDAAEARMRTRLFVVFHSFDESLSVQLSHKEARKQLAARHAFFTRR